MEERTWTGKSTTWGSRRRRRRRRGYNAAAGRGGRSELGRGNSGELQGAAAGHLWEGKRVRKDAGEEGKEEGREERARGARTAAGELEYGGGRDNSGEQFR